jgi:hypothetical protein
VAPAIPRGIFFILRPFWGIKLGAAYGVFEFRETKSLFERRVLASGGHFLKGSAVRQVVGWTKSCCRAFELRAILTERKLPYSYFLHERRHRFLTSTHA